MFDPSKPFKTRHGRKVELISTTGREPYPFVGYIDTTTTPDAWKSNGKFYSTEEESGFDLINTPQEQFVWVNVYKYPSGELCLGSENSCPRAAKENASPHAVGRIKIKLVEGQWDD